MLHITLCPNEFPAGYYWYDRNKCSPGHPARWVQKLVSAAQLFQQEGQETVQDMDKRHSEKTKEKLDTSEVENSFGCDNEG